MELASLCVGMALDCHGVPTSNQVHDLRDIVGAASLVHDGQRRVVELLGEGARTGDAADVGRHHDQVACRDPLAGQIVEDDGLALRYWIRGCIQFWVHRGRSSQDRHLKP